MQVFAFFYVCWRSSLGYHIPDYLWLSRGLRNFQAMDDGGSSEWESVVRRWGREWLSHLVECHFCSLAIVQQYFNNKKVFWGAFLRTVSAQGLNKELPNHLLLESLLKSMWRGSVPAIASLLFTLAVVVPAGTSGTTPSAPSKPMPLPGWRACGSCKWLPCSQH